MRTDSFASSHTMPGRDALSAARHLAGLYLTLTKARLSGLVVVTTAVGYLLTIGPIFGLGRFIWTIVGTAVAAGGANALNQCLEAGLDARMRRTEKRPVPSGALGIGHALTLSIAMAVMGPLLLAVKVNPLTGGLATATILLYTFVYGPLKTRSTSCTLVGAVCGAIPPMMGCSGATGTLDHRAAILFAILFVWQIPHFLALAWMYRDDYARGGFKMMPVVDTSGSRTCRSIVMYGLALLPISFAATLAGMAGWVFAIASVGLGMWFLTLTLRLDRDRTHASARRVFLASLVYLPLLLGVMVADRGPAGGMASWESRAVRIVHPSDLAAVSVPGEHRQ